MIRMANLARIQWDMQEFLLRGSGSVNAHVVGTERVPADVRLAVYGNAYASRLVEALETNYPALAKLLGEADFNELATEYVAAHDSRFFSIRYYGHALAHFLASTPRYRPVPFLAEVARWEWTLNDVFDAADAECVGIEAVTRKSPGDWGAMRLTFHPSLRTLALHWNVAPVWKALVDERERPRACVSREATTWLLWRHELKELFRPLSLAEEHALVAARAGEAFGEVCAVLCEHMPENEAPAKAAELLKSWVESGLISSVT